MNFYFNYFTSIGREQVNCHLSSVILSFPEKGNLRTLTLFLRTLTLFLRPLTLS